jgi:dTDP-4-amino-4,6-dideoxygalactose transaminase
LRINIVKPELPSLTQIKKEFSRTLNSGKVTNYSKNVILFEKNLKNFFKSKYTPVVFSNGEMALYHLIQAWRYKLKIEDKNDITALVPSFTFSGTINALILNNIKPIFCDIDETLTLDLKKIPHIDKNTRFIIPVSVYGNIPDLEKFKKLRKNIVRIIDSAPAFGSTYKKKYPHEFGLEEIYSFHATKIMTSMEGGCAITNDATVNQYLKRLRDFGQFEKKIGNVDIPGLNSKMQEISAIVGNYNLKKFPQILNKRKKIIKKYKKFFDNLEKLKFIKNMKINNNNFCSYLYFPIIILKDLEKFQNFLLKNNIVTRRYYTAVHDLKYYKNKFKCSEYYNCKCKKFCQKKIGLKVTEYIKDKILALPLYSNMKNKETDYMFKIVNKFFNI